MIKLNTNSKQFNFQNQTLLRWVEPCQHKETILSLPCYLVFYFQTIWSLPCDPIFSIWSLSCDLGFYFETICSLSYGLVFYFHTICHFHVISFLFSNNLITSVWSCFYFQTIWSLSCDLVFYFQTIWSLLCDLTSDLPRPISFFLFSNNSIIFMWSQPSTLLRVISFFIFKHSDHYRVTSTFWSLSGDLVFYFQTIRSLLCDRSLLISLRRSRFLFSNNPITFVWFQSFDLPWAISFLFSNNLIISVWS